ncbi:MAG: HIT family hydrolase [Deltaproteobacteria bacterium GWC2_42_51]|nr:MAG: HIT family hydrolase [Deltaproteobacteria bacterium GWA2_42_85]OGP23937.1 MAG: HIT family hydrolase [Deltaproteobacteria bacterium GWB2_42_7]OGP33803.1 MAG: HIT family hydrolase [Deltaproteobacteria bacterium GWC2_42_51]OGP40860.1 MAG: HIT family hydrolase [Deltaproteobacteria bacterium GWD2_42_10]OGP48643.1 MAG: HIT family hydrolase [Deltaproteobacteria bacterium GWF2_42_12]OGQ36904.1 MAG: HIT family hydrolase [Deltaproteobacteria bacterium RIFCSPLOWO2_02_FULL_42_39]OGQ70420.1 MAG: H
MKQLWAPWRVDYILGNANNTGQKPTQCIFCKEYSKDDKKELVLYRGSLAGVMMNKFPYNNGHLLVYPWKHSSLLEDMDSAETIEVFSLIKNAVAILKKEMSPGGFNIGMNLGKDAGAGIDEHLHFHVVPRWGGDTNFMPVISEVRVIPEHLQATYDKLYPHFQRLKIIS